MKLVSYKDVFFLIPASKEKKNSRDVGMQYWWGESLKSALSYTEQLWYLHTFVALDNLRVLELFAGLGVSTAPLRSRNLTTHVGVDHDPDSLSAFKCIHSNASARCSNTYTELGDIAGQYDYILAEYNALTTYRALHDKKEQELLHKIFYASAQYIVYTDAAKVKEHLHYSLYTRFFDCPVYDSDTYVEAVANYIKRKFNYGMIAATFDSMNYTFLFEKGKPVSVGQLMDAREKVEMKSFKEIVDADV